MSHPATDIAVSVRNVTKRYDNEIVLNNVNLTVKRGQFFGLLGPNGAGKSTLINIISGLAKVNSGKVEVMGADVEKEYRLARHQLGLVPQELVDEPFFDIKNLLKLQSGYFSIRQNESWINELLGVMELTEKANMKMSTLSGGMKRRVLVAMALVHKPSVVILDEPTAGVDINLRKKLWKFIRHLHHLGHTIILTTHYLEEAETLCDHIAIIDHGQIIVELPKDVLLKQYGEKKLEQIFVDLLKSAE